MSKADYDTDADSGVGKKLKHGYQNDSTDTFSDSEDDSASICRKRKSQSATPKTRSKQVMAWGIDSDESGEENLIPDEEPLLLVRFLSPHNDSSVNMVVVPETVERVLRAVIDIPICTIILIGPPGQGKSFLANFIIRKLESMEKEEREWMGWSDKRQPLTGFPWRAADKRKSFQGDGIYVWHRPFVIDSDEGRFGVVLMESNGFQDDLFGSQKMQTSIFGLNFLMSSILIYTANASFTAKESFQNGLFIPWIPYIKLGAKTNREEEEKTPFQNLSFLIRDWADAEKYSFGSKDGRKFLSDQVKALSDEKARRCIQSSLKFFSSHDCFLLPPASEIFGEENFDGSLEYLPPDFAKKLSKYVDNLISDGSLPIKKVGNGTMSGYDFKIFLSSYVDLFNLYLQDQEKLSATTLYNTNFRIFNDSIVRKCVEKYQTVFEREQRGVRYLVEDLQQVAHENANEKAELTFKKSAMKAGDKPVYKKRLTSEIKEAFSRIHDDNEKRRNNFITECILEACKQYEEGLQRKVVFPDELTFHEENEIRVTGSLWGKKVTDDFFVRFDGESKENLINLDGKLRQKLGPILESVVQKNSQNRRHAEKSMENVIDLLLKRYKADMSEHIAEEAPVPTPMLLVAHKIFKKIVMRKFGKRDLPGKLAFRQQYSNMLNEYMEDAFMTYADGEQSKIEAKQKQGATLMNKSRQQYQRELQQLFAGDELVSEEDFRSFHRDAVSRIMPVFQRQNPFHDGTILGDKLNRELADELQTEFETVLKREIQLKQKVAETCENAKSVSLQQYIEDMEKAKFEVGFIEDGELIPTHERILIRAIGNYDEHTKFCSEEAIVAEHKFELEGKIQDAFERFKDTNILSQQGLESEARMLVKEFKSLYAETMSVDGLKTEYELEQEHEKKVNEIAVTFSEMLGGKGETFKKRWVGILMDNIGKKFTTLKQIFEVKVAAEEMEFLKVVQRSRDYYHEQMKKECENSQHISSKLLEVLHESISKDATKHGSQGYVMTEDKRGQLKESLEESYVKYKMEYTMYSGAPGGELAIGIDLGTTYCCVAVLQNRDIKIITNQDGEATTPSYIAFNLDQFGSEDNVIGHTAKDDAYRNPENTIFDAKRIIGRKMDDEKLQSDMKFWPFRVVEHDGAPKVEVRGKPYPPEQISAILLSKLKEQVEARVGQPVKKAVITVPAYFNDGQRAATKDAGEMAGFEVLTILNEPTAAAIAYKVKQFNEGARKVVVFDLGGGTFDVAVLQTGSDTIDVLSVGGDTHLGGEDFDKTLMKYCVREFKKETGLDLLADRDSTDKLKKDEAKRNLRRLQTYCEKAKRALTSARQAKISVDNFASGIDLHVTVTRQKFEELNMHLFKKTIKAVDDTLKSAEVSKDQVDDIVLIGGSTKIPKVQEMLSTHFNNRALDRSVNADEAVAYGAAVQAALLNGPEGKRMFNFKSIRDVIPMSLGISATINGVHDVFSKIISKNTKIPHHYTKEYYTTYKNQSSVRIAIYQGEEHMAKNNELLGEFSLENIPPGDKGEQKIDVRMEVDSMGITHVKAICKSTNGSNEITVKADKGRLTEGEKKKFKAKNTKPGKGHKTHSLK
ncbi:unnamed protein product [Orchesella dallaii]|uniref:Guanylate-binding protein N-terminal domain-containing protein n=1 Tax=Orchesella dallaii TaxID=48710 RepID=A0ABP1RTA7_9HEXA